MRCKWADPKDNLYIEYHDKEWGRPTFNDRYLLEMLILESFQAGLSWKTVLHKRAAFKKAYDDFEIDRICAYDDQKVKELLSDKGLIKSKAKIEASITNARIFKSIVREFGSFYTYLRSFTKGFIIYENDKTSSPLSKALAKDLKRRGMRYVGEVTIYAYLCAVGIINAHEKDCFLYCDIELYEPQLEHRDKKSSRPELIFDELLGADREKKTDLMLTFDGSLKSHFEDQKVQDMYEAYIYERQKKCFLGKVSYRYCKEKDLYGCEIFIDDRYLRCDYFKKAMYLLFKRAKSQGIKVLYSKIEAGCENKLKAFESVGFVITCDKAIKKDVCGVILMVEL